MPYIIPGVYLHSSSDLPYEAEECYFLDYQITCALAAIDYLFRVYVEAGTPFGSKYTYYHFYTDHLLFSWGQIASRFVITGHEKGEELERTAGFPKVDLTLLSDFWDYCLMLHYCSGNNPVYVPAASSASPTSKQAKLHKLTRVPAENLKMFDKRNLDVHDGPHCGAALMGSSISSKAACALRWRDISWPTDDPSYALVKLDRPDVLCAVHNFTRPLVPAAALTLYKRRQHLAEQYSPEILRDMYVVTTKSDPTKPMLPSALVQETKRFLLETGIDRNKLLQSKESRSDPISARILTETYKDLITHTCGVPEGSGTYKFLLAQAIFNDVTSSNYVSFTSEAGSLRLYKYLRPTAPLKLYDRTLMRRCENGTDIIEVNPSDSTRCAGMISDTILYPGQEIILEAETGLTGTVEAEPLEDPTAPAESSK